MMKKMRILVTDPGRKLHYSNIFRWLRLQGVQLEFIHHSEWRIAEPADIVLTSCEHYSPSSVILCEAKSRGIPTLHIADGVLEWRNTWTNPRSASEHIGMPLFQPVLSDKIACIGSAQGRLLSSLGNYERVEITGLPRLDSALNHNSSFHRPNPRSSSLRLLIATANTPYFTPREKSLVQASISDLNKTLQRIGNLDPANISWRIHPSVVPSEQLFGKLADLRIPLSAELQNVDRFISTPSTVILESMALGVPTCKLDYTNSPAYLATAWSVYGPSHMQDEISLLLDSDLPRYEYQRYLCHDQIRADGMASMRVGQLMFDMIDVYGKARISNIPALLPPVMTEVSYEHIKQNYHVSTLSLFPAHKLFARSGLDSLNAEIGHLRLYVNSLESALLARRSPKMAMQVLIRRCRAKINHVLLTLSKKNSSTP